MVGSLSQRSFVKIPVIIAHIDTITVYANSSSRNCFNIALNPPLPANRSLLQNPITEKSGLKSRRGLKGGLDNAIKQAEDRGFQDMFIIDSDCHQSEPFYDFAEFVEEPYRSRILAKDPEVDPWLAGVISRGMVPFGEGKVKQHTIKGMDFLKRPETSYPRFQHADELVRVFTKVMRDIGIKRSIVFPTSLLSLPTKAKPEFEARITKAYIEYMINNFLSKHSEILSPIVIPTMSPLKAAELIDDFGKEKGVVGIMISGSAPVLAGSDEYDPIYEAAQNKGLPVCYHANLGIGGSIGLEKLEFVGLHTLSFPLSIIRHIVSVVLNGVSVRFPNLRFVFVEGGVTWIPWIMNRMDDEYIKRKLEAPLLSKLPSEYMKEFYYTSQPLEQAHPEELEHVFPLIDAENHLLYASDYPHWDFDVPSVIYDLPFISTSAKKKIMGENASKLFKIN